MSNGLARREEKSGCVRRAKMIAMHTCPRFCVVSRLPDEMKLSEPRVLFLARESLAKLRDEGLAEISNFPLALRQAREIVAQFNEQGDEIDAIVRRKINSIKRGIVEGSNEWTLLYKRYRDEETRKKGPQR